MRSELLDLALPVANDTNGSDDERRLGEPACFFLQREMSECLDRFAQAHVVGENAAEMAASQELQPPQSLLLIGAQRCLESRRRLQRLDCGEVAKLGNGFEQSRIRR